MISSSVAEGIILHTLSHVAVANPAASHQENTLPGELREKLRYAAMQ
ncbi:hypothetical protein [Halomonas sp.]